MHAASMLDEYFGSVDNAIGISLRAHELEEDGKHDSQALSPSSMGIQGPAGSNRVVHAPGAADSQGAVAVRTRTRRGGSVQAPFQHVILAGSADGDGCAKVGAPAEDGGRVGTPTTQGVLAGSARAKGRGGLGACVPKDETLRLLDVLTVYTRWV
ncbi:unnamed protein product [Phytophthora fragariaefolia]|uniref:Unnamed protein product n=1 Tax=Phytophthora fragariaefolia TaxID=1490495 RepID=A0A9W6YNJ0_9STRA|nr:unnamed protein product [Phytophthora fragariaefolia]